MTHELLAVQAKPETIARYVRDGRVLAVRWLGVTRASDPAAVVAAFLSSAKTRRYASSTLGLYKAQILAYLRSLNATPAVLNTIQNFDAAPLASSERRTSGLKLQKISQVESRCLLDHMRSFHSESASPSEVWLVTADFWEATLILGLRPVEWTQATIRPAMPIDAEDVVGVAQVTHRIDVVNAKHNAARGNGETRTIYAQLTFEQAKLLQSVITIGNHEKDGWRSFYKSMSNALRYSASVLWPRRKRLPSFYTARHQAIANAKASGELPNILAAVFGHASDMTARKHYSRARNGDKNLHTIYASRLSLARVRNQALTSALESPAALESGNPQISPKEDR